MMTVVQNLHDAIALFEQKNGAYQNNYRIVGEIYETIFPSGVRLHTAADFNRFAIFMQMLNKLVRYGAMFDKEPHVESLDDLMIYAAMLKEIDLDSR